MMSKGKTNHIVFDVDCYESGSLLRNDIDSICRHKTNDGLYS